MAGKYPKLEQLAALRIARATAHSSRGRQIAADVRPPIERATVRSAPASAPASVATGPREATTKKKQKLKRSPAGTFDRKSYQREYMRKRRQAEKRSGK